MKKREFDLIHKFEVVVNIGLFDEVNSFKFSSYVCADEKFVDSINFYNHDDSYQIFSVSLLYIGKVYRYYFMNKKVLNDEKNIIQN